MIFATKPKILHLLIPNYILKKFDSIVSTEAGLITGNLYQIPNRAFLPTGLRQSSCDGQNYSVLGSNLDVIQGSSIGFSNEQSMMGTIGEFCERYASSFEPIKNLVFGNYSNLHIQFDKIISPLDIRPYADWQYLSEGFPYVKFTVDDEIAWTKGKDLYNHQETLIPAFLTYLPHNAKFDKGKEYILNTSTGVSAGSTLDNAIESGVLECIERDAFSNFWYNQKEILSDIPLYSQDAISKTYFKNSKIQSLYKNPRVKISTFDLTPLTSVNTILSVLFYQFKGRLMLSVGAASRFNKADALIKAALEAYQGIEYGILLFNKEKKWERNLPDFKNVDSYQKHFAFYNKFPEFRSKIPILNHLSTETNFSNEISLLESSALITNFSDITQKLNTRVYYCDLTTEDTRQIGFHVVRVIMPDMSYLTGVHDRPFLGSSIFKHSKNLFTEFPHFFP